MRVTKDVAAQNRRKILETATQLFKGRGIDNVSIADLSKVAGFTHGGFYNHFESKADLSAETIRYAFDQSLAVISGETGSTTGDVNKIAERLANYVSAEHRDDPASGCPTGSLPVDVGRQEVGAQRAFADGLNRYFALIERAINADAGEGREAAIAILATLAGAIILSRAVREADPQLSDEILRAAREEHRTRLAKSVKLETV